MKKFKFEEICWPLKLGLRNFAEQSLHCPIILRGKEWSLHDFAGQRTKALLLCGTKSALLHNFAGQSLHCSMILRGQDMDFRAKIQQQMRFSYFLKKYFIMWPLFQISIAPWWPLMDKPGFPPRAWVGAFCSAIKNPSLRTSFLLSSQISEPEHKLFAQFTKIRAWAQAFCSVQKNPSLSTSFLLISKKSSLGTGLWFLKKIGAWAQAFAQNKSQP